MIVMECILTILFFASIALLCYSDERYKESFGHQRSIKLILLIALTSYTLLMFIE